MPPKKQLLQMEDESVTMSRENPALYGRGSSSYCVQLALCPHLIAPCLHEEADTRMFACATEAAKRPYK